MSKFNLNEYETVKSRKERFYKDNPDGRIIVELRNQDTIMERSIFKATIYKNKEDQEKGLIWATGYALEIRDTELKRTKTGQSYESVNYSSWTENCEESAVGRALDNAGYSGNKKCSREEIIQAEKNKEVLKDKQELGWTKETQELGATKEQREIITELVKGGKIPKLNLEEWKNLTADKAEELIKCQTG